MELHKHVAIDRYSFTPPPNNRSRLCSNEDRIVCNRKLKRTISAPQNPEEIKRLKMVYYSPEENVYRNDLYSRFEGHLSNSYNKSSNTKTDIKKGSDHTSSKHICLKCKQVAQLLCSGCHQAWYCSQRCQVGHKNTSLLWKFYMLLKTY